MPVQYVELVHRIDAARSTGDPEGPLKNIADDLANGDAEDRAAADEFKRQMVIDLPDAARILRLYVGRRALGVSTSTAAPPSSRAGDAARGSTTGGRRHRRKTRRHGKKSRKTHRRHR